MTPDDLARLRSLAEAATPGPWSVLRESHGYPDDGQLYVVPATTSDVDCVAVIGTEPGATPDAAYIAALDPQTVRDLIDAAALGLAWNRVEAALEDDKWCGWNGPTIDKGWHDWEADAIPPIDPDLGEQDPIEGRGPTPTAALLALADKLEAGK